MVGIVGGSMSSAPRSGERVLRGEENTGASLGGNGNGGIVRGGLRSGGLGSMLRLHLAEALWITERSMIFPVALL